mmetsp:Transcript_33406/g.88446  ORF Transcript_33406/g.88446 Transcript_33406/m.88446 type:complete len:124 (+) Transcript_33406:226-597(+)
MVAPVVAPTPAGQAAPMVAPASEGQAAPAGVEGGSEHTDAVGDANWGPGDHEPLGDDVASGSEHTEDADDLEALVLKSLYFRTLEALDFRSQGLKSSSANNCCVRLDPTTRSSALFTLFGRRP